MTDDERTCEHCDDSIDGEGYHVVSVKTDEYVAGPYCSLRCRSIDVVTTVDTDEDTEDYERN